MMFVRGDQDRYPVLIVHATLDSESDTFGSDSPVLHAYYPQPLSCWREVIPDGIIRCLLKLSVIP